MAALLVFIEWAMTCGLMLGIGGTFFGSLCGLPKECVQTLVMLIFAGLVAAMVALLLHGIHASPFASRITWAVIWDSGFALRGTIGITAGVIGLGALLVRPLGWLAALTLAVAYGSNQHGDNGQPLWLIAPSLLLHLLSLSFWAGALIPLIHWTRRADGASALRQFSEFIPYALVMLIGSGMALGMARLSSNSSGLDSDYGRVLTAKLILVIGLIALGGWNRWKLTAAALSGAPVALSRLRRTIATELVVVLAIFGLTSVWGIVG